MNHSSVIWQSAVRAFEAGHLAQAQASCEEVLSLDPHHAEALHLRGMIAFKLNDLLIARNYVQRALKKSAQCSVFHNSLGIIEQKLGCFEAAEASYRRALRFDPHHALAYNNLGDLLESQERLKEAEECYQKAIDCDPNFAEAHNNLGLISVRLGRPAEALHHLSSAIKLRPDYLKAYYSLSLLLRYMGRYQEAQVVLQQALKLKPDYAEAWHDLGLSLKALGDVSGAIAAFEKALQHKPELDCAYLNLGNIYFEKGLSDRALEYFKQAQAIKPTDALKLRIALSLPGFYESTAQIQQVRARLRADLEHLEREQLRIEDPYEKVSITPFYLAYHGENDVALLSRIADLLLKACPALGFTAPHCLATQSEPKRFDRRLEIGFISFYFGHTHIVNRVASGVISRLPRDRFRVTLLHLNGPCEEIARSLQEGDRLVKVPLALAEARQRIAAEELDILFYTDLGLEPWTYFLSFARLAPIQLTSGGHPITSGVPNVDYFISSSNDEVAHAQQHYRERLVLLAERPFCYHPAPAATHTKTRADFGLSENKHIYLCPMTPFKLHPETDQLFAEILSLDPKGELVFVINCQTELWERLKGRFARTMSELSRRIRYLPYMTMPDFVALLRISDVILDTPSFNGGTTSLEALAVGTPIVTLPGELLRQRGTYSLYNHMGLFDCVAKDRADYAPLAVEIASSPERRNSLKQEILSRNQVLFGQEAGIYQLADFLLSVVSGQSKGENG